MTARLLTHQRTQEETVAKLHRPNFLHRACCIAAALSTAATYQEAAERLVERGWFTELGATAFAAAMEAEGDDLLVVAMALKLPIEGLVAIKAEAASNVNENDISI